MNVLWLNKWSEKKIYARRKHKTSKRRPEKIKLIKLMKFIIKVRLTRNIKKVKVK